ncbi:CoxG family protein [Bacillus horti]|uniref:Carbon monoxide dehydrogenase subunit G n=1 Tax=Caldalkalibacillus horti TaxID=77523 RepID=A0ABT9W439_9BACI|nr:SRPBCC family protein [Bacillus horti]MDQ0168008.1 carbon monoxide dehydrogenase subunit G [Bacillus horti]
MPSGTYTTTIPMPVHKVWSFVKDVNNWAPLVPGYQGHEQIDENTFNWTFKVDVGFFKREVQLQIKFTDWQELTKISYNLNGITDQFSGEGYFEFKAKGQDSTQLEGYLELTAKGAMASMINSFLKSAVPQMVEELSKEIAEKIKEQEQR